MWFVQPRSCDYYSSAVLQDMCGLHREHTRIVDVGFFFTILIRLLCGFTIEFVSSQQSLDSRKPKPFAYLGSRVVISLPQLPDFSDCIQHLSTAYPHPSTAPARRLRAIGQTNLLFKTSDSAAKRVSTAVTLRANSGKWRAASPSGESMQPTLQRYLAWPHAPSSALGCWFSPRTPSPGFIQTFRCTSRRAPCSRKWEDGLGSPSCEFCFGMELVL